jgi:DNA-directed RNA polymerase subunit M/transcription elongation factor TFIIS
MIFCPHCERVLRKSTVNSILQFTCDVCGERFDGDPEDTLIASKFTKVHNNNDLLKYASHDRVNKKLKIECSACKLSFMTLIVTEQSSWVTCLCGVVKPVSEIDQVIL